MKYFPNRKIRLIFYCCKANLHTIWYITSGSLSIDYTLILMDSNVIGCKKNKKPKRAKRRTMLKKRWIATGLFLILMTLANAGCAVIGAAASAGIGYAIYQATRK
jgi:hypothetical protein